MFVNGRGLSVLRKQTCSSQKQQSEPRLPGPDNTPEGFSSKIPRLALPTFLLDL